MIPITSYTVIDGFSHDLLLLLDSGFDIHLSLYLEVIHTKIVERRLKVEEHT